MREFVNLFHPDYLRFYIASICSYSQDDINFDWNDFEKKINNELIANIGNFVNRTLTFIKKNFGNEIPIPTDYDELDKNVLTEIERIGKKVGNLFQVTRLTRH